MRKIRQKKIAGIIDIKNTIQNLESLGNMKVPIASKNFIAMWLQTTCYHLK